MPGELAAKKKAQTETDTGDMERKESLDVGFRMFFGAALSEHSFLLCEWWRILMFMELS